MQTHLRPVSGALLRLARAKYSRPAFKPAQCATTRWIAATAPTTTARNTEAGIFINSHFDSGNIEVLDISDPTSIKLNIHEDPYCDTDGRAHAMWFNFRMTGVSQVPLTLHITNAGSCSFPEAWPGYQACASYDLEHWFRVPTSYDKKNGVLSFTHTPTADAIQFAFFPPYTYDRHQQLVARMQAKAGVKLLMIGETLDGHDLDLLQFGSPAGGKPSIWIIHRQHPGESMAEWFAEGLLERLTDKHDPIARALQDKAVLYVMPNVCPDGTWRGHIRTNAAGINLNRAWADPDEDSAPEVYHLLRMMDERGVDLLLDVHGDEELPYNFVAGAEGIPGWSNRLNKLQCDFKEALLRASPDFQTEFGYEVDLPGQANMGICTNQVAQRYDCLALTLEMPFKDTAQTPNAQQGWSPERSKLFGAAVLTAVHEMLPKLIRADNLLPENTTN